MEQGLVLFDQDNWYEWARDRMCQLECELFSWYPDGEYDPAHVELIKEFYSDNMKLYDRIPTLFEIMEDVWCYNHERTWEMAEIEVQIENMELGIQLTPEELHDKIAEKEEENESYYSDCSYYSIETYVEDILCELHLAYSYCTCENERAYYELEDPECELIANDCQAVLFYEFLPHDSDERDIYII